jgi:UDP-N-acetylglucosamine 2-epimerase (non-hydrolysing)
VGLIKKRILFVFGTRPEAIKMAPVISKFQSDGSNDFDIAICVTAQHRSMLDQVLTYFSITPDFDLNLMKESQDLFSLSADILTEIKKVLMEFKPDLVFVQGDTTTAFVTSLAAFYLKIKVAHLEAGLRSDNKYSPYPEEINRKLISVIADIHFVPTMKALGNLERENFGNNVFVTGNSVIDALFTVLSNIEKTGEGKLRDFFGFINFSKRIILVTGHRRENFGFPLENICNAIKMLSLEDIEIVFPVHLNPNVQKPVKKILKDLRNVHLIEPLNYPELVWLMKQSYIVLTDSGGIQEEAPSLGKPVIVMRDVTERTEGIESGNAILSGTSKENIYNSVIDLLRDDEKYTRISQISNPYGCGVTSDIILSIIKDKL